MDCKKAKILLAPHILGDLDNEPQRCKELQAHLLCCPDCTEMYDGFKETIGFVLDHKVEFAQAFKKARAKKCEENILAKSVSDETVAPIKKAGQLYKPKMTVEEGWQDLCRRCPELAENTEKPKSLQLFLRVGAVAACLVIGIFTWMVFTNNPKQQNFSQNIVSRQVATVPKPSVRVELVKPYRNIAIDTSQAIVTDKELKTLLINGKHRMVMNAGTSLSIQSLTVNAQLGCIVKLTNGQIYTHVQHDGNPFIIDTANGQAVITGTTFDIKATDTGTTLVVSEGTVQFESEKGVVNVTAGQTSEIVGQFAPSTPLSCNTVELTAWATGYKPGPELAQSESDTDSWYLSLSLRKEPIVLDETDYDRWVEQKRDWFKQEFPWIFQLKEALAKEGIEVDYPELLIKTGDAWQFVCLEGIPARFSVINPDSLFNMASNYGFDKQWLLENVPAVKYAREKQGLSENSFTGLKTFERWLEYLDETKKIEPPTPIYSFHASKYLAETRSLIWFAIKDGKYDLTNGERNEILALLQEEVTAACKCQNDVLYPEDQLKLSCDDRYQEPSSDYIGYIEAMKAVEKRIAEYGIDK